MTPVEFKAWFEGFVEAIDKQPTLKQWARIKERVAEIDGKSVSERVYIDRYWQPYINYGPIWRNTFTSAGTSSLPGAYTANAAASVYPAGQINTVWDSSVAMHALGKADAANLN